MTDAPDGFVADLPDDAFTHVVPAHGISGRPRVHLRLSADLADFDLLVELYLLGDRATFLGTRCSGRATSTWVSRSS